MIKYLIVTFFCTTTLISSQSQLPVATGNPLVPGYFADPSIFRDDSTYYIFSTTDGYDTGKFTTGPFGVWYSHNLAIWSFRNFDYPSNFPYTSEKLWAPSVTKGPDEKYYMYYVKDGYNCFVVSASSPLGPWKIENDGNPIYKNMFDTEVFTDDDGSRYLVYQGPKINGSYAIYMGKLKSNMIEFEGEPRAIYQNFDLFEGPGMFKRNGKYYLFYSNGSLGGSYHVNAAYGDSIWGPYKPHNIKGGKYEPILQSDTTRHISATGHNSVIKIDGSFYIVYHRKSYPYKKSALFRQICIDKLNFDSSGRLTPAIPSKEGITLPITVHTNSNSLIHAKKASATSRLSQSYKAEYAIDNNNGTLWKAADTSYPQTFFLDLGKRNKIQQLDIFFEYPTERYRFRVEVSLDNKDWKIYEESVYRLTESPVTIRKPASARYIRLTITETSMLNQPAGIWELKVY